MLFSLFVTGGAFVFSGVVAFFGVFASLFSNPVASIMFFGMALLFFAFGIIVIILTLVLTQNSFKVFGSGVNKFINEKRGA